MGLFTLFVYVFFEKILIFRFKKIVRLTSSNEFSKNVDVDVAVLNNCSKCWPIVDKLGRMSQARSYSLQREVQLRFLSPDDIPVIKRLCTEWFPIEWVPLPG